jgi:hypothetical protein
MDRLANRLANKPSVEVVLEETLKEADASSRILAVYGLGAADDLPMVLDCLSEEKHPEIRVAAITDLQHWMSIRPGNDAILYRALESKYKSGPAEAIMELLHPYSEKQRKEPETYETFIACLKHEKLAIRQLAYFQLINLVPEGRKIPYDPAGGVDQLEYSFEEWKKLVPTGKLPPEPSSPSGKKPESPDRRDNRRP